MLWEDAISNALHWMEPFDENAQYPENPDYLRSIAWSLIALQLPKADIEKRVCIAAFSYITNPTPATYKELRTLAEGWAKLTMQANAQARGGSTVSEGVEVDSDDAAFPGDT